MLPPERRCEQQGQGHRAHQVARAASWPSAQSKLRALTPSNQAHGKAVLDTHTPQLGHRGTPRSHTQQDRELSSGTGTHVSAIEGVWSAGQHCAHAVWVFEFDEPKASRLVGCLVFHDHAVHDLSILGKVAAQRLCSKIETHAHAQQGIRQVTHSQPISLTCKVCN